LFYWKYNYHIYYEKEKNNKTPQNSTEEKSTKGSSTKGLEEALSGDRSAYANN